MRILVLIDRYFPILGGAQNNVREMSERLSSKGFDVTVLTRKLYPTMKDLEVINQVSVKRFAYFPIRIVSKLLCLVLFIRYLIKNRHQYDIILCVPCVELTDLLPAYLGFLVTKKPYIIRATGLPTFYEMQPSSVLSLGIIIRNIILPPILWRKVLNNAKALVVQSRVLEEIAVHYQIDDCEVIPNGVDSDRFNIATEEERRALRLQLGLSQEKILIVNTGRYDSEKNQITLIKAAELIHNKLRPGAIAVVILGATQAKQATSNEEALKEYVKEKKLEGIVQFIDDALNVEDYLRASDIFVHPTKCEGMSNALIEAMSCGLPVVCSDIPQETCMFPDEKGLFFSPENHEALVRHLIPLIDSKEHRKSYGDSLARFSQEHYSNVKLVEKYADLFRRIDSKTKG